MRAIYGKKIGMTRIFTEDGIQVPVTIIEAKENTVSRILEGKIQIAAGAKKRLNKPEKGNFEKLNIKPHKVFEIKTEEEKKVGDKITVEAFKEGEMVNITGISKGKGFAGTVKRHNFNTGPRTHGSNNYRQPGSIGDTGPQRVVKGKRMGGHMGARQVTISRLEIFKIMPEKDVLMIKGPVPGNNNSWNMIWSRNEG